MCVVSPMGITMLKFQCKVTKNVHINPFSNIKGKTTDTNKAVQNHDGTEFRLWGNSTIGQETIE